MAKKDLKDYITTVKTLKPSAEVKFRSKGKDGEITEVVASREYVAHHIDKEIEAAAKTPELTKRLNKVTEKAGKAAKAAALKLEEEAATTELLEDANVEFDPIYGDSEGDGAESPMTHVPNAQHEAKSTAEMSETAMLIKLVSTLIDKIDSMQNFNPVIHVPAPIIHVTLPETKRIVTKAIERDENNWIKTVREHVEEFPAGEPLIEVHQKTPKPKPKAKRKTKAKDNK